MLGVNYLAVDSPSREVTEPDRVSHLVFLLREVVHVFEYHSGFPFVEGGVLVTEGNLGP